MPNDVWYFLTCALDTVPFIYFLYQPLRYHLRFSQKTTLIINYVLMLLGSAGFVMLHNTPLYTENSMLLYRLALVGIMLALVLLLTKELRTKALFVFSLIFPFIAGLLLLAAYIAQFIKGDTPTYMVSSLIRLALTAVMYPLFLWLWKEIGRRANKITVPTLWRYLWMAPASTAIAEALLIGNTYEFNGVALDELLSRLALWIGSAATCWLMFYLADRFEQRIHLQDVNERNELLLALQAEQYQKLADSIEETRAARHDMRHHLGAMKVMSEHGEYARLDTYLGDLIEHLPRNRQITVCENYTANIILDHFIARAKELDVPLKFSFHLSHNPDIADADLCVLIGNALENALEAVMELPADKRFITARALEQEDRIYMTFDNSFCGKLKSSGDNAYLSRKRGFSTAGVGIPSIRTIVKKYSGDMRIDAEDEVFRLSLLLIKQPAESATKKPVTATAE